MSVGRRPSVSKAALSGAPLRVAIVAESFLPAVNGVTNSVLRVVEHLRAGGHDVIVIAPGPGNDRLGDVPIARVRAIELPRYDELRVGLPLARVGAVLRDFRPDVVHLAAPTILGAAGVRAANRLGIPSVAVFQTDLAGFAKRNGLGRVTDGIWSYLRWVHSQADLTLAPSTTTAWALRVRGVPDVQIWARGVDLDRFHPRHRSPELHRFLAPRAEVLVGYIGRVAREKQVDRLAPLCDLPGVRVVVVGDGADRPALERAMPDCRFVGFLQGEDLSRVHATLDVFVHTGIDETFCQSLQESMASGVPSVAPSAGGPLDLVHHRQTGFFWSPEVPETLTGAVAELADDPGARRRMGIAARCNVEHRPWSRMIDELTGHYRTVIAARVDGRTWRRAS